MAILLDRIGEFSPDAPTLPVLRVDLWKRRVSLDEATQDGVCLYGDHACYRVVQLPEEVVAIPLPANAEMAAKIGWYLGNRHIPIEVRETEIVMEIFPTLTESLTRIGVAHEVRQDVLRCRPHSTDHRH